jgi:hypothetical protein
VLRLDQPSVSGLVDRIATELAARAVVLLHENGQVLQKSGWIEESEFPSMAALVAAMIATGKSLSELGESFLGAPTRFACDSEAMGLYTVAVADGIWLAVLYEQPLNPGQFRMRVRRYAELLSKLGVERPLQQELTENVTHHVAAGATSHQGTSDSTHHVIPTMNSSMLFTNITDDEIDRLFENARS